MPRGAASSEIVRTLGKEDRVAVKVSHMTLSDIRVRGDRKFGIAPLSDGTWQVFVVPVNHTADELPNGARTYPSYARARAHLDELVAKHDAGEIADFTGT
jgi:hypothetical protein